MSKKIELCDAFGEMIYVVAKADGNIQEAEIQAFEQKLEGHPWAEEIKWSFHYEMQRNKPVEELYNKVIDCCKFFGPQKEYALLIEILEEVANACSGITQKEAAKINRFSADLLAQFRSDLENIE